MKEKGLGEAVFKSVSSPLSASYLKASIKEIEQTAVAVSVVGTTSRKLKSIASIADPVVDSLRGIRPEVDDVRLLLRRQIHNVKNSSTKPSNAAKYMRELCGGLIRVKGLLDKGLGNTDSIVRISNFDVVNTWGYTNTEVYGLKRVIEKISRMLVGVGLPTVVTGLAELNPKKAKDIFVAYVSKDDLLVFNLGKSDVSDLEKVLGVLAERLWIQEFGKNDKETWGNGKGLSIFSKAFSNKLAGQTVSGDMGARLKVTVGKLAANWA